MEDGDWGGEKAGLQIAVKRNADDDLWRSLFVTLVESVLGGMPVMPST